jgi:hypothetical protein
MAIMTMLFAAGLCTLASEPAYALSNQCRVIFTDEYAERLHLRTNPDHVYSYGSVAGAMSRMRSDVAGGHGVHPFDMDQSMTEAKHLLDAQGAHYREINLDGYPALEIMAESQSGWNRMARRLVSIYDTRVLFSPAHLALNNAYAMFSRQPEGQHNLFISVLSLRDGRGQMKVMHEAKHAYYERLRKINPSCMNSSCYIADPDSGARLFPGAKHYALAQHHHEMATVLQHMIRAIRLLREEDSPENRHELVELVEHGREIMTNAETQLRLIGELKAELDTSGIELARNFAKPDPNDPVGAVVELSGGSWLYLYATSAATIEMISDSQPISTSTDLRYTAVTRSFANAPSLMRGLHENSPAAKRAALLWLSNALAKWNQEFTEARAVFSGVVSALDPIAETASVARLMEITNVDLRLVQTATGKIDEHKKTDAPSSVRSK